MGTSATIIVSGGSTSATADAFVELEALEAIWSRFRPSSELCRLNQAAGRITVVSRALYSLIEHLESARRLTGGRFDPTLHDRMIELGYDRTYRELVDSGRRAVMPFTHAADAGEIVLLPTASAVLLPDGVHIDPGGLGKGLGGDLVARSVMDSGARGVMIDIGGDIVTRGLAPDGGPWRIEIPRAGRHPAQIVELTDGAVATSDTSVRTWTSGSLRRHHVLDPDSGLPLTHDVEATVIAGAGWWAEAMATAVMVSAARHDYWFDARLDQQLGVTAFVTVLESESAHA